jgi:Glutamate-cysteine ligase family 2(GCS2)
MAVIEWLQNVFEGQKKLSEERRFYKKIDEQLVFATSQPLTVGVECELALLDAKTLRPAHMGLALIEELASPQIKKESFEHMVEVTSTVSATVHETATQLKQEMEKLAVACEQHGLLITGTGRPPTIRLADIRQVPDERYERLNNERKILNERFGTLGMHVHLGMPDAEQCVRYHNFFMHFVPHLIALSAARPLRKAWIQDWRPFALPLPNPCPSRACLTTLRTGRNTSIFAARCIVRVRSKGSRTFGGMCAPARNTGRLKSGSAINPRRWRRFWRWSPLSMRWRFGSKKIKAGLPRCRVSERMDAARKQAARHALWPKRRTCYQQSGRNEAHR